jgi:hypothetical protein
MKPLVSLKIAGEVVIQRLLRRFTVLVFTEDFENLSALTRCGAGGTLPLVVGLALCHRSNETGSTSGLWD